jgi:transcriptional regulator with GAF, ATPase, and Fis domain
LFLDEIGDMALGHQAKLLRVIESAEKGEAPTVMRMERVGEPGNVKEVDVRLVAATNRDLRARDVTPPFRLDLYYRLCMFQVQIPPLRERRIDVRLLAENLVAEINQEASKRVTVFEPRKLSDAALRHLQRYAWPGNVRELKAVLIRAIFYSAKPELSVADIDRQMVSLGGKRLSMCSPECGSPALNWTSASTQFRNPSSKLP